MTVPEQIVRSKMMPGHVLSNTALSSRLYSLRIEVAQLPFVAGQFVRLELTINDAKVAKPYSLVNTPDDQVAEIFYNVVPGGLLSNALASLQAGDPIFISQPATGFFTLKETPQARDIWLIATGTGLGPFLSILRTDELWERFEHVVLVHGVPLVEELVYQEIIKGLSDKYKDRFRYVSCVTREDNPLGLRGRATDMLANGLLEQKAGLEINKSDSSVMLCGSRSMITDMQKLLALRGMCKHLRHSPGQIVNEQYF